MNQDFSSDEIRLLLKKEEERRRRQAKKRQAEILALMEEQNLDFQGKLWGEDSISALTDSAYGGNGYKWGTDFEARLVPYWKTPERVFLVRELFSLAREVILTHWTEKQFRFFCFWLESDSWEQLALETDYSPSSCVTLIKEMVAKIRERVGTRPNIFPFSVKLDGKAQRKIRHKIFLKRTLGGESIPADAANRVYLDRIIPDWRKMSLDDLWAEVRAQGYQVSRAAVWRAQQRGRQAGQAWFMKPGWSRGERVFLSPEDKALTPRLLAAKYGLSFNGAAGALKRGYFVVNSQNRGRVVKEGRDISNLVALEIAKSEKKGLGGKGIRIKVSLQPEDLNLSARQLAEKYCLKLGTAQAVLRRRSNFVRLSLKQYRQYCGLRGIPCEHLGGPLPPPSPLFLRWEKVYLTEKEREMRPSQLAKIYNIRRQTAAAAKKRGWFNRKARSLGAGSSGAGRSPRPSGVSEKS